MAAMPWRRPASTVDCGALTAATQHSAAVASIAAAPSAAHRASAGGAALDRVLRHQRRAYRDDAGGLAAREDPRTSAPLAVPEQAAASLPSEWPSCAEPRRGSGSSASRATSTAKSAGLRVARPSSRTPS